MEFSSNVVTMAVTKGIISGIPDRIISVASVAPHVEWSDAYYVLNFVIILTVLRFILAGCNHYRVSNVPNVFTHLIKRYKLSTPKKTLKLAESLWYLLWHTSSLSINALLLAASYGTKSEPLWVRGILKDLKGIWFFAETQKDVAQNLVSWPNIALTHGTRMFLLLSTGFWLSCNIYIHFETRRSDMKIMRFHHLTTCTLLILAYIYNFNRISLFVIFFHDIPDVFLYLTKVMSYIPNFNQNIVGISFITYAFSHFFARFILMGMYVAYPIFVNMDIYKLTKGNIEHVWQFPGGIICPLAIAALTVMNIYWFNLIIKLLKKFLFSKETLKDEREEDDDDE